MKLTLQQTSEMMGLSEARVKRLTDEGRLTNLRPPKRADQTKVFRLFDSKQVKALMQELRAENGEGQTPLRTAKPAPKPVSHPAQGILSRLDRLETKIDQLLKIWS